MSEEIVPAIMFCVLESKEHKGSVRKLMPKGASVEELDRWSEKMLKEWEHEGIITDLKIIR